MSSAAFVPTSLRCCAARRTSLPTIKWIDSPATRRSWWRHWFQVMFVDSKRPGVSGTILHCQMTFVCHVSSRRLGQSDGSFAIPGMAWVKRLDAYRALPAASYACTELAMDQYSIHMMAENESARTIVGHTQVYLGGCSLCTPTTYRGCGRTLQYPMIFARLSNRDEDGDFHGVVFGKLDRG
jgi:hypothetical protein